VTLHSHYAALLFAFALLGASAAQAQDRSPDQLIEAGVGARRAGNDEQALVLFTQAWEAGHAPRARAQMGLAEQALGKYVEAKLHLAEALAATGDAWITGRRAALEEALAAVSARLGQLDVRSEQAGARLRINGRDAGALPLAAPLWVMPGTIAVEVSAPGFASSARTLTVTAGQLSRERFELVATAVTATPVRPPPPVEPDPHPRDDDSTPPEQLRADATPVDTTPVEEPAESGGSVLPVVGWITAGVGVVGVGLGVYFYTARESAASTYNDNALCVYGDKTREERCGTFAADARSAETMMTVSLIGGGVFLAGGLVLALVGGGSSDTAPPAEQARVSCAPVFGSVVGAACEGRF
jgi:hypothetical protein